MLTTTREEVLNEFLQSPAAIEAAQRLEEKKAAERLAKCKQLSANRGEKRTKLREMMAERDAEMAGIRQDQEEFQRKLESRKVKVHGLACEIDFMKDELDREQDRLVKELRRDTPAVVAEFISTLRSRKDDLFDSSPQERDRRTGDGRITRYSSLQVWKTEALAALDRGITEAEKLVFAPLSPADLAAEMARIEAMATLPRVFRVYYEQADSGRYIEVKRENE
jgi:chromosome segregation ATPase